MKPPERDAPDRIAQWLWQGREPERPCSPYAVPDRIDLLVLCYMQHQEPWNRFEGRGFAVLQAPFDDDTVTMRTGDEEIAHRAARAAFGVMYHGGNVLITCHQGFNRSGLVSALALRYLQSDENLSGAQAAALVREARPGSLYNPAFNAYLESLK
jgi:protein-tyrosine phosphatase